MEVNQVETKAMEDAGNFSQLSTHALTTRLEPVPSVSFGRLLIRPSLNRQRQLSSPNVLPITLAAIFLWLSPFAVVPCLASEPAAAFESSLLNSFLTDGFPVVTGVLIALPAPLLSDSDSSAARTERLESLSARHGWQRFSRPSVMAPVHIELSYIHDATGRRVGHHVYSAFIVHAALSTLRDQELMDSLFGANSDDGQTIGFQPEKVADPILESVSIAAPDENGVRFSTIYLPLMNRVALHGTARIEKQESDSSITIAWHFDPAFTFEDWSSAAEPLRKYANRYTRIERDELGRSIDSSPVPYSGCGGYLSVRETGLQPDQLLIESHMVLHEPMEWFAGSNFLRSKLPTVLQESAQSFRRRVMKTK